MVTLLVPVGTGRAQGDALIATIAGGIPPEAAQAQTENQVTLASKSNGAAALLVGADSLDQHLELAREFLAGNKPVIVYGNKVEESVVRVALSLEKVRVQATMDEGEQIRAAVAVIPGAGNRVVVLDVTAGLSQEVLWSDLLSFVREVVTRPYGLRDPAGVQTIPDGDYCLVADANRIARHRLDTNGDGVPDTLMGTVRREWNFYKQQEQSRTTDWWVTQNLINYTVDGFSIATADNGDNALGRPGSAPLTHRAAVVAAGRLRLLTRI